MAYQTNWGRLLTHTAAKIVEGTIVSTLRENEYRDTVANFLGGGYLGGGLKGNEGREWIFEMLPGDQISLRGIRKYNTEDGEKPLQGANEITETDQNGNITKYSTGKPGTLVAPNPEAEILGLHYLMTGGGFLGEPGRITEYKNIDVTRSREAARDVAIEHFERKCKSSQRKPIGGNLYTIQLNVSDSPFRLISPGSYDFGLSAEYGKIGAFFEILDPFFRRIRETFVRMKSGGAASNAVYETHLNIARELAKSGIGNAALAAYPAQAVMHLGKKLFLDGWNFGEMGIDISPKARRN